MARTTLACLLPARNAEHDLPDYFASVVRFADAVVALDDGSTDRTRELLRAHPLVKVLLTNPPRPGYSGWDDHANRQRLLEAAAEANPEWILSLDADERIDADDAAALRAFVERDAIPGLAYGFPLYRMLGNLGTYDPTPIWAYRLFAFEPGQHLPVKRLHFVKIPTSIPRERWVETTIRIQHVGSLTAERRRRRYEKYREADPDREFQASYENLLELPRRIAPWERRPAGLPVLAAERDEPERASDAPLLSAIVISQNDEDRIERAVRSVVEQECPVPFEVIVVTSGTDRTASIVRERFPPVRLVELPEPALPGEARNAGLRIARGEYVSFPGSHVELPPGSLAARIRAHQRGYGMVEGTTLNGTRTLAGWATYFLGCSTRLPGRPSEELEDPPRACSYARRLLLEVGGFREDLRAGEDTVVNLELAGRGYAAYHAQDVTVIHHSPCRDVPTLLRHHFRRGRGQGRILLERGRAGGLLREEASVRPSYVARRVGSVSADVQRWGAEVLPLYRRVYPLVVAAAVAAWLGLWYELLRPGPNKLRVLFGSGAAAEPGG